MNQNFFLYESILYFIIQYRFYHFELHKEAVGLCSSIFPVLRSWWGNIRIPGDSVGTPRDTWDVLRRSDLASLLPGVVFQLVVVVQTVIAMVWSRPVTANLAALRVAGTLPKEIRTPLRKNDFKSVGFTWNWVYNKIFFFLCSESLR